MSHPVHQAPGSSVRQAGGMASQEILMGTTAADETPPIGTLRQRPLLGDTSSAPSPRSHAPATDGADHGAAHLFLAAGKRLTDSCRCCRRAF